MASEEEQDDKIYEPTQRKLDEARKKGDVPRSQDVLVASSYLGIIVALFTFGEASLSGMGEVLATMIGRAEEISGQVLSGEASPAPLPGGMIAQLAFALAPILILPGIFVIIAVIAQRAFVVAPSKLMPKLSKISPISNAKNKFGRSGLFEFAKSFLKLCIYAVALAIFIAINLETMLAAPYAPAKQIILLLGQMSLNFLFISLIVSAAIASIDFMFQRAEFTRRNRMSHKELKDETKQSEGDPHIKQRRRERAREISQSQMMAAVPEADVVIVNPEHYAVALKWTRQKGSAPECVAKGVDEVARAIREIAAEAAIPLHRDPPTARALYATVEIGDEIPEEQYMAVAAAIRFAEDLRVRWKAQGLSSTSKGKSHI